MKNLLFMRHGKSSWELDVNDQDRPLAQRGIDDANLVGKRLLNEGLNLDFAFSSPANRALHTAMICLRNINHPLHNFQVAPQLYDFSGNQVLNFVKELNDQFETIMIFGHNHAFTYLANDLGNTYIENVPTSGFVRIQFNVSAWKDIQKGTTIHTIFPKHL